MLVDKGIQYEFVFIINQEPNLKLIKSIRFTKHHFDIYNIQMR